MRVRMGGGGGGGGGKKFKERNVTVTWEKSRILHPGPP